MLAKTAYYDNKATVIGSGPAGLSCAYYLAVDGFRVTVLEKCDRPGGMCHLDAGITEQGLNELGTKDLDLVGLENVGILVCPDEFDTGAVKNVVILSVPEEHDKPLKYALMFEVCHALIINKIDVLPYFDFDMQKLRSTHTCTIQISSSFLSAPKPARDRDMDGMAVRSDCGMEWLNRRRSFY